MNMITIFVTGLNIALTAASVTCAIISVRQTKKQNDYIHQQVIAAYKQVEITSKQTEIAQQQLELSREPDFPTTMRLESIAHSIQRLDTTVKEGLNRK